MTSEPSPAGGPQSPVIVEDVFLTDAFLIKGRMAGKYHRLSKVLEDTRRGFLSIEDATMVGLNGSEVVRTPRVMVAMREIVLAHEFVDAAGDEVQRMLADPSKNVLVRAFYSGNGVQLELSGHVEPGAYEPSHGGGRRWFVMQKPALRGLDLDGHPELDVLRRLGYAIVHKEKLSYVYDFG